jgi:alpha-tubulin suppressor-like RCC1 family protein
MCRAILCIAGALAVCLASTAGASATSYGVMAWGENEEGQLGLGGFTKKNAPATLPTPSNTISVSAGGEFSLALIEGGTVKSWGGNVFGELGNGTTGGNTPTPVEVKGLTSAKAIAAGEAFGFALLENGTVKSWGWNVLGQLGIGTTTNHNEPVAISGLSGVTEVAAGGDTGLALLEGGTVKSWGWNEYGQLGDGTTSGPEECVLVGITRSCSTKPVEVTGFEEEVKQVSMGGDHGLALLKGGTVEAWGRNQFGQLGDGTTTDRDKPVKVEGLAEVKAVEAGSGYSVALMENGTVKVWGANGLGQLGVGSSEGPEKCSTTPCSVKPVEATGLSKVTSVSAGFSHSLALLENGTVKSWGSNYEGQLGVGKASGPETCQPHSEPCSRTPVLVHEIARNVVAVSAGEEFSLAVGPPGPIISKIKPSTGSPSGGTLVTITGYHLTGVTEVKFGSGAATGIEEVSATELRVKSPAGSGTVHVVVTTSGGSIPSNEGPRFRYAGPGAPEYGRCVAVAEGTGEYSDAACTTASAKGSFNWEPGVAKAGFTLTTGEATLETVGKEKIVCSSASGSGEYLSPKLVASSAITLTGCVHAGAKCTSTGAGEGELVTSALEGELEWVKKTGAAVGLALRPSEASFIEGKCGATKVEVIGSVIAKIKTNEMLSNTTLTLEAKEGKQKPSHLDGGPTEVLETLFAGGKLEQTGLSTSITQANEEAVEVNTVV